MNSETPAEPKVTVTEDFAISADGLWAVLGDFSDLSWVPATHHHEFEGDGPGMVRRMYLAEGLPPVVERLDAIDESARSITYSIPENNPLPVNDYQATMTVVENGPDSCRLIWTCNYETADLTEEQSVAAIEGFYGMVIPGIHAALGA